MRIFWHELSFLLISAIYTRAKLSSIVLKLSFSIVEMVFRHRRVIL